MLVIIVTFVRQKALSAGASGYTPSWVKYRYGAWYLPPKLSKKHPVDEPLHDPKEPKNKEVSETKSKSLHLVCSSVILSGSNVFVARLRVYTGYADKNNLLEKILYFSNGSARFSQTVRLCM